MIKPEKTNCGSKGMCKDPNKCLILSGMKYQFDTSARISFSSTDSNPDFRPQGGRQKVSWNVDVAKIYVNNCVKTSGNCPKSSEISKEGEELIARDFG